jgi:thiamine-phosphate pyrophosphorylase
LSPDELRSALRLYLVADPDQLMPGGEGAIALGLKGGATCIQYRAKSGTDRDNLIKARALQGLAKHFGVPFLVNDRIDWAMALGADGVHLGVDDVPVKIARTLCGPNFIIGYSPETDDQIREAAFQGASYLGLGPVFGTVTKSDAGPAIGLDRITAVAATAGIPVIGIGGITADNAGSVIKAGAIGVAVVSAISKAANPEQAARDLRAAVDAAL